MVDDRLHVSQLLTWLALLPRLSELEVLSDFSDGCFLTVQPELASLTALNLWSGGYHTDESCCEVLPRCVGLRSLTLHEFPRALLKCILTADLVALEELTLIEGRTPAECAWWLFCINAPPKLARLSFDLCRPMSSLIAQLDASAVPDSRLRHLSIAPGLGTEDLPSLSSFQRLLNRLPLLVSLHLALMTVEDVKVSYGMAEETLAAAVREEWIRLASVDKRVRIVDCESLLLRVTHEDVWTARWNREGFGQ